jgi:hypothetical protein
MVFTFILHFQYHYGNAACYLYVNRYDGNDAFSEALGHVSDATSIPRVRRPTLFIDARAVLLS